MTTAKYKRVLLKLSGEALAGEQGSGILPAVLEASCRQIKDILDSGTQVALVVGGGNMFRGVGDSAKQMDRTTADQIGMLATVMNGLALKDQLQRLGVTAKVMSALFMPEVAEPFVRDNADAYLNAGQVVIFTAGTGNPYFSTDTCAALRAAQIKADLLLKGTKVDGIYDSDPVKNPAAKRYDHITYQQILDQKLGVMDLTAIMMCQTSNTKIQVFNMTTPGAIHDVLMGADIGTLVTVD